MTTANHRAVGFARTSTVRHIVTGVDDDLLARARGTNLTAECGTRVALANDLARPQPGRVTLPAGTCRRCATALGCTVETVR